MNQPATSDQQHPESSADGQEQDRPAGLDMKDPTDTDHPAGKQQAAENAATESPT